MGLALFNPFRKREKPLPKISTIPTGKSDTVGRTYIDMLTDIDLAGGMGGAPAAVEMLAMYVGSLMDRVTELERTNASLTTKG